MSGLLTTHILDTANGCPAAKLKIELFRFDGLNRKFLKTLHTNSDGRTDKQVLSSDEFETGEYEMIFHVGEYFDTCNSSINLPRFLNTVPIRFGMSEHTHYHVPLLVSPFGYSTYRGS